MDGLLRKPVTLPVAHQPANGGGVPTEPGLYAWWAAADAIPGIGGPAHPAVPLYPAVRAARKQWTKSARPAPDA